MDKKQSPLIIDESACNGCGRCVEACFMNVLEMVKRNDGSKVKVAAVKRPDECVFCEACVTGCRRIALFINPRAGSCGLKALPGDLLYPLK